MALKRSVYIVLHHHRHGVDVRYVGARSPVLYEIEDALMEEGEFEERDDEYLEIVGPVPLNERYEP